LKKCFSFASDGFHYNNENPVSNILK